MTAAICLPCSLEGDNLGVVFRDDLWAAEVAAGYEVPGWVVLRTRRHAERITGLNEAELAAMPYRLRGLVSAATAVMGAPATYLLSFGELYPHFHVLVTPRGEDVPLDRRAGNIMKLKDEMRDPDSARSLAPALREAYAALPT